jgi:hypothetical protein
LNSRKRCFIYNQPLAERDSEELQKLFKFFSTMFVVARRCKQKLNAHQKIKRITSIFKDESTGSCICLWKLAVAVATYVSICIVYRILLSFAF